MKRLLGILVRLGCVAWLSVVLTGCKKPSETVRTDLEEAGYELTAEDWFRASRENDAAAMGKFVVSGFKVDLRNLDGDSALHVAASAGAENSAAFLLKQGVAIESVGAGGRTALMVAVVAGHPEMTRWLLRQGANPQAKDAEGYEPLMLAVREGRGEVVAELAPLRRERLEDAILLAALLGKADVIEALANYGASPYARMEDGRTPLMIAAENGHLEAVSLLLDLGANRYAMSEGGQTAVDFALAGEYEEIEAVLTRAPSEGELALEDPLQVAGEMNAFVERGVLGGEGGALAAVEKLTLTDDPVLDSPVGSAIGRRVPRVLEGAVLSNPVTALRGRSAEVRSAGGREEGAGADVFPMPPLVMRHYRERNVPIEIQSVRGDEATLRVPGRGVGEIRVRKGEGIPGSHLTVLGMERRMEDSKLSQGRAMEVSVMTVRDSRTGVTREWISSIPATAHDPVALVEDSATGQRYLAAPGQRFRAADGASFIVTDVRPSQLVIEDASSGAVQSIPLRGPRG